MRKDHSPASREAAQFVADWFENVIPSNQTEALDLKMGDYGSVRRTSAQSSKSSPRSPKISSRPPRPPRSIQFENDILIYQRKQSSAERSTTDPKSVDRSLLSLKLPLPLESKSAQSSARSETGGSLGRSWSELLAGPLGADEQRDHKMAVRACRVQGVDTSPRCGKDTARSSGHSEQNIDLLLRERELFLKERALFLKERERFLAEKEDFHREKKELLRRAKDTSKSHATAEAVCLREYDVSS